MQTIKKTIVINFLAVTDGGQVTRSQEFLKRLEPYNEQYRIILFRRQESLKFCDEFTNISIIDVRLLKSPFMALPRIIWENTKLYLILKKIAPDYYLTFSHYLPVVFPRKIISIIGVSNMAPFTPTALINENIRMKAKMWLLKYSIVSSCKRADHIIALSKLCFLTLVAHGIKHQKITVIPNGVNKPSDVKKTCKKSYLESNFILYVSSYFPYKNHKIIIQAYQGLEKKLQEKYKVIFIGKVHNRNFFKKLKSSVKSAHLTENILFFEEMERDELASFYRRASLFIFPSLIENCPNILLEAMSFSCPILCSNAEPMREFGGPALLYFDPLDANDLTKLISRVSIQQKQLHEMSKKSYQQSKKYSWETFTSSVIDVLRGY